ncbi:MAG: alpha-L-fucosidase [Eudoraea sp.]|uniref:alpha-L-fucosidase n=1 Tax=Eudoraea sp. TaxID=1979955 RepID=UPI00326513F7
MKVPILKRSHKTKNILYPVMFFIIIAMLSCKEQAKKSDSNEEVKTINYLEESNDSFDERMKWWRDARFGMFIHWGPYSVPAGIHNGKEVDNIGEWIMNSAQIPISEYEEYAKQFNPQKFDAKKWARTMKEAGMKYVVITSKHHDGFGLWDSKVSDYDIVDFSPYGQDILKALSEACKEEGIRFGVYHSIMDWHHPQAQGPNYPEYNTQDSLKMNSQFPEYYTNYLKPQVMELLENYDPEIIWFDGEWIPEYTHEMGQEMYQYLRELKPSVIINNRVDKGRQGMQGMNKEDDVYAGDFGTPEQEILEGTANVDWESCMTMNDTWGYKLNDHNWKSAEVMIHNLVDVASKGGNYLLNVGPTSEGEIPEPSLERLQEIGDWLRTNGEVVYGTEKLKTHFKQGDDIRFTKKREEQIIYAISLKVPKKDLVLKYVKPNEGGKIELIGYGAPLNYSYSEEEGLLIIIPEDAISTTGNKYAWSFKINGVERTRK